MLLPEELKHQIEEKYGHPIRYPKDCEALAAHISRITDGTISASTLKRLFGFNHSSSQSNLYTLDLIARYIGYANWDDLNELSRTTDQEKDPDQIPISDTEPNLSTVMDRQGKNRRLRWLSVMGIIAVVVLIGFYRIGRRNLWYELAPLPEVRGGGGFINYNGDLFYLGGMDAEFIRDNNWRYSSIEHIWREETPMPAGCAEMGCTLFENKIYCFGGWLGERLGPTDLAECYNIEKKSWEKLPKLPLKSAGPAVTIGNQIYIIGGTAGGNDETPISNSPSGNLVYVLGSSIGRSTKTCFFRYDPSTKNYTKLSVFKVQRVNVSLVVVGNHIMAIGGNSFRDGEYMVNKEVDEYDPISNNWIPKAPLPEPLTRSNALFKDREVHLFGGSGLYENNPKAINNQHLVYNLETNNWRVENSLPYEVFGHRCTHQNGKIIIVGGTNRLPNPSRKVFIEK